MRVDENITAMHDMLNTIVKGFKAGQTGITQGNAI